MRAISTPVESLVSAMASTNFSRAISLTEACVAIQCRLSDLGKIQQAVCGHDGVVVEHEVLLSSHRVHKGETARS